MKAELAGIRQALIHAFSLSSHIRYIYIHCDSRSALQAIGHINPTDNYELIGDIHASTSQLEHRGINITFNRVPSHIGINGNELADSIALEARQLDSYTYDPPPSIASCFEEMLFNFK